MKPVVGPACVCVVLCTLAAAQELESSSADTFRSPGWNYGVQVAGGASVVQVASTTYATSGHTSNVALSLRAGRVLTHEHGNGWLRGTLEVDLSVIPMELFFVLGTHYAGGFEAPTLRWNFTHDHGHHIIPFAGASFGMLFSPENFPPGNTEQFNFTAAVDLGTHVLVRQGQSLDTAVRISHLSHAYLGAQNPGVPGGTAIDPGLHVAQALAASNYLLILGRRSQRAIWNPRC